MYNSLMKPNAISRGLEARLVTAVDLWNSAADNDAVIREAGVSESVTAMQLDARNLPFADEYFDAIISIDAIQYFGTDSLYLPYILRFLKPRGTIAFASAGLMREFDGAVPEHLVEFWRADAWCIHTRPIGGGIIGDGRV